MWILTRAGTEPLQAALVLGQDDANKAKAYVAFWWAMAICLVVLFLALLLTRVIRVIWARSDARARESAHKATTGPGDAWAESARRVQVEDEDEDERA